MLMVEGARLPEWVASVQSHMGRCSGPNCKGAVLWCTTRNKKNQPLELVELEGGKKEWQAHHARCPDVEQFRRGKTDDGKRRTGDAVHVPPAKG